jgi:hypothetical protein
LIKLVKAKITATNPSTIAKVPLMMSRKYKTAITAAMLNLMSLSVLPMFFVMIVYVLMIKKGVINIDAKIGCYLLLF